MSTTEGDALFAEIREVQKEYPGCSISRATRIVLERGGEKARRWNDGDDGAAPTSHEQPSLVDAGQVLMQRMHRTGETFREACLALPATAAAYDRGELIAVPEKRGTVRGVPILRAAGERHYSELSEAEKGAALPGRRERRLAPGERVRPGEVRVAKMAPIAAGGGTFAVLEPVL